MLFVVIALFVLLVGLVAIKNLNQVYFLASFLGGCSIMVSVKIVLA